LALRRKVESGELSQTDADRVIGQAMFRRFVPEAAGGPTTSSAIPLSYEDFYKQDHS
jgi:hypothetical protein